MANDTKFELNQIRSCKKIKFSLILILLGGKNSEWVNLVEVGYDSRHENSNINVNTDCQPDRLTVNIISDIHDFFQELNKKNNK